MKRIPLSLAIVAATVTTWLALHTDLLRLLRVLP
jgi:hypothetical protein